jgi:hypothetical protein
MQEVQMLFGKCTSCHPQAGSGFTFFHLCWRDTLDDI